MLRLISFLIAAALWFLPAAHAEMVATPLSGDARLVTFDYDPDNTYQILSKPKAVTHLELPEGETIQTVVAGDTAGWELTPSQNLRHFFLKPKHDQLTTSMTLITERRSYQFVLRSTGEGSKWYQRVTWRNPNSKVLDFSGNDRHQAEKQVFEEPTARPSEEAIRPEDLRFDYTVTGDAPFKPLSVFDNGKMIWLRMPQNLTELPVVFAADGKDLVLVNYIPKGDSLLVQRLVAELILKIGKTEVRVKKAQAKRGFFDFTTDRGMP